LAFHNANSPGTQAAKSPQALLRLIRGDKELRELLARLDPRNPRLRRVRDLVLSGLHMKAAEQRLPPLPAPQTAEERELIAIYHARFCERDACLERVRQRILAHFEANPPAPPSAPLLEADVIDLRARIHVDGVAESRGPPRPKTANAPVLFPTEASSSVSGLSHAETVAFPATHPSLSRKTGVALQEHEARTFRRDASRRDRGWQRLGDVLSACLAELGHQLELPTASLTTPRPTRIFQPEDDQ
jgi:hypothetical protein